MLGHKLRDFKQHLAVSLEALVPQDNFYRQVDQCIDLSLVCDLAADFYSSLGHPSIDPVVIFRLQLIAGSSATTWRRSQSSSTASA